MRALCKTLFLKCVVSETRGGTIPATQFLHPVGITVDRTGHVFVSDTYFKNVRKFVQS